MPDGGTGPDPDPWVTIEGLSALTAVSVRNLRSFRSRGLLDPPSLRGRVGYYGPEHRAQVEHVRALQAEGFTLATIERLLGRDDAFVAALRAFRSRLNDGGEGEWVPFDAESHELTERYAEGTVARFIEIGSIRRGPDGQLVTLRGVLDASWALNRMGATPEAIIELLLATERHARTVAAAYVGFLSQIWQSAERPADPERMRSAYDELTPVASELIQTMFQVALAKATEREIERALESTDDG